MDSEILLRSVPTVFSSPSLLGMIQAFKLADQIMGFHPRRGKLVGWLKCGYAGWTKAKWEVVSYYLIIGARLLLALSHRFQSFFFRYACRSRALFILP